MESTDRRVEATAASVIVLFNTTLVVSLVLLVDEYLTELLGGQLWEANEALVVAAARLH